MRQGFTLIELMIAVTISALIIVGLNSAFTGIIKTREGLDSVSRDLKYSHSMQKLISQDIRMTTDTKASKPDGNSKEYVAYIISQNALMFNKSVTVNIYYYVEDSVLYREETNTKMNYSMRLPLLTGVKEWKAETYDNGEYKEGYDPKGFIYNFSFVSDDYNISFITGRAVKL